LILLAPILRQTLTIITFIEMNLDKNLLKTPLSDSIGGQKHLSYENKKKSGIYGFSIIADQKNI
jgi:hypothetical protein